MKNHLRILLADDVLGLPDRANRFKAALGAALNDLDREVRLVLVSVSDSGQIPDLVHCRPFHIILLDLQFGQAQEAGIRALEKIRRFDPCLPIIMLTGAVIDRTVKANQVGHPPLRAWFMAKPWCGPTSHSNDEKLFDAWLEEDQTEVDRFFSKLAKEITQRCHELSDKNESAFREQTAIAKDERLCEVVSPLHSRSYVLTMSRFLLLETLMSKGCMVIVYVDLDRTQSLNETLGYTGTNTVLVNLASTIRKFLQTTSQFMGRYYREQGSGFVLLYPDFTRKDVLRVLDDLRIYVRNHGQAIFNGLSVDRQTTDSLTIGLSMGVFAFPEDLPENLRKNAFSLLPVIRGQQPATKDHAEAVEQIILHVMEECVALKDSAKDLGRDQTCHFGSQLSKRFGRRLKVGIVGDHILDLNQLPGMPSRDVTVERIFRAHLDPLLYDVQRSSDLCEDYESAVRDVDSGTLSSSVARSLQDYDITVLHYPRSRIHVMSGGVRDKVNSIVWKSLCGVEAKRRKLIVLPDTQEAQEFWENLPQKGMVEDDDRESRVKVLPHTFITEAGGVAKRPAGAGNLEVLHGSVAAQLVLPISELVTQGFRRHERPHFFPRFTIQKRFFDGFEGLKKSLILYRPFGTDEIGREGDEHWIKEVWNGLNLAGPESIWVSCRKGIKDGDEKWILVLPLQVTSEEAYRFLYSESSRMFIKIQNYFDGFLSGFLGTHPDGERIGELIRRQYPPEEWKAREQRYLGYLAVREANLPNSTRESFGTLCKPGRVRLDVNPVGLKEFNVTETQSTKHVSFAFADRYILGRRRDTKRSPVDVFLKKHRLKDMSMVTYLGSEMIGPSVFLGELAGIVTWLLSEHQKKVTILDMFSGSGATVVPSLEVGPSVSSVEVDQQKMLKALQEEKYRGRYKFCKGDLIGKLDKVFADDKCKLPDAHTHDLAIADPPHYLVLSFLNQPYETKSGTEVIAAKLIQQNCRMFVTYFAHSEQHQLIIEIIRQLKEVFDEVWYVRVGGEVMALCHAHPDLELLGPALEERVKGLFNERYGIGESEIWIERK